MLIFILSVIFIFLLIFVFKDRYLHPFFIFSFVWSIVIVLWSADYIYNIVGYIPITKEKLLIIFIINSSFIIGSISFSLAVKGKVYKGIKGIKSAKEENIQVLYKLAILLFVLSSIGYIFYVFEVLNSINLSSDLIAMFREWNYQSSHGELEEFGGVFGRLYILPIIGLPLNIFLMNRYKKSKLLIIISIIELFFLFSPRRALLISTVIISFLTWAIFNEKKLKINFQTLLIVFLFSLFFSITQFWLNKSSGKGFFGGIQDIYIYITGNIPSLHIYLDNLGSFDKFLSYNVPLKIAKSLGLTEYSPNLSLDFISIPFNFNTVPYLFYFIKDFGIYGTAFFMWILGLLTTSIYYKLKRGKSFFLVYFYVTLLLFIIFSFRENSLIVYNTWYALFVTIVITIVARMLNTRKMVL